VTQDSRHYRRFAAALSEITIPLTGSTITPVVVFLPLIVINGVTGTFFRALAVTLAVSLFTSLILALTWHAHSEFVLDQGQRGGAGGESVAAAPKRCGYRRRHHPSSDGCRGASLKGFFLKVVNFQERWLRAPLQHPNGSWPKPGPYRALLRIVRFLGSDLLPENGRRRLHRRLHHARRGVLGRDESRHTHIEQMLHEIPESRVRPRRTACSWSGCGNGSEHRRHFSETKSPSAAARIDDIMPTSPQCREEPAINTEFIPGFAGHDRRSDQRSRTGGDQTLLAGYGAFAVWAPKVAETIHNLKASWMSATASKTPLADRPLFQDQSQRGVARRFSPEEVATDAAAMLGGEPAPTPIITNDRALLCGCVSRGQQGLVEAMRDTLLTSSTGRRDPEVRLPPLQSYPAKPNSQRESAGWWQ